MPFTQDEETAIIKGIAVLNERMNERTRLVVAALVILGGFGIYKATIERYPLTDSEVAVFKSVGDWKSLKALNENVQAVTELVAIDLEDRLIEASRGITLSGTRADSVYTTREVLHRAQEIQPLMEGRSALAPTLALIRAMEKIANVDYPGAQAVLSSLVDTPGKSTRLDVVSRTLLGTVILLQAPRGQSDPVAKQQFELAIRIGAGKFEFGQAYNGLAGCLLFESQASEASGDYKTALQLSLESRRAFTKFVGLDSSISTQYKYLNNTAYADLVAFQWYLDGRVSPEDVYKTTGRDSIDQLMLDIRNRLDKAQDLASATPGVHETRAEYFALKCRYLREKMKDEGQSTAACKESAQEFIRALAGGLYPFGEARSRIENDTMLKPMLESQTYLDVMRADDRLKGQFDK